jgi:hypothetical protein
MPLSRRAFLKATGAGALALGAGFPELAFPAPLPGRQLRALRSAVSGRVLAPGNAGYSTAKRLYNPRFDGINPPAVVQVENAADVQAVVKWANRFDVDLVGRAGGHAYNGGSTSRSAVVVDTGGLDGIGISGRNVTAGPGVQMIDLYAALTRKGLIIPAGSCPSVGLGGLVLGGGMGLAGRALGLTLDAVTAFDVVMANGKRAHVDANSDPDLFWALRGGGGSFALVTKVYLRATPRTSAAWFMITYPAGSRGAALSAWESVAPTAPDGLTAICTVFKGNASAFGQFFGSQASLRRIIAPLTRVPGASTRSGTAKLLPLQKRWAGCGEGEALAQCRRSPRTTFDASSVYIAKSLGSSGAAAFVQAADAGATLICDAYGGAISDVSPTATAFAHRNVRFSVQIASFTSIGTATAVVRRARGLIAPFGNGGAYPNYADLALKNPQQAYYGQNLPRLRQIKQQVDPDDRFRTAQGIS